MKERNVILNIGLLADCPEVHLVQFKNVEGGAESIALVRAVARPAGTVPR